MLAERGMLLAQHWVSILYLLMSHTTDNSQCLASLHSMVYIHTIRSIVLAALFVTGTIYDSDKTYYISDRNDAFPTAVFLLTFLCYEQKITNFLCATINEKQQKEVL